MSQSVTHGRHALAIDDERKIFHPVLWDPDLESYQTMEQVWFAGMHTDVGGGYAEQGLADLSLEWMVEEAVQKGLLIYPKHKVGIRPNQNGIMHDSRGGRLGWLYRRKVRQWDSGKYGKPVVHKSALERTRDRHNSDADYKPWICDLEYTTREIEHTRS